MSLVPMVIEQTNRGERSFDITVRILAFQVEKLCDNQGGRRIVDFFTEEHNAVV